MKVVDGEIEIDGDDALRRAQLIKIIIQTLAISLMALQSCEFLLRDEVKAKWILRFKKWRREAFGAPPLTEEQIKEAERQVMVEALKVVRSGDEPGC